MPGTLIYFLKIMVVDELMLKRYKCVLASFMSFVHDRSAATKYDKTHIFADEVLLIVVTPDTSQPGKYYM